MAIWQFHIQILSKREIEVKYQSIPEIIGENDIENLKGWSNKPSLDKATEILSTFLQPKQSWMDGVKQWGEEDKDCVELFFENSIIDEIIIKIDLRNFKPELLDLVMDLSNELEGLILIENRLYKPVLSDLIKELNNSNASKFLDNPKKYLDDLDDE